MKDVEQETVVKERRKTPRTVLGYAVIDVYARNIQNKSEFRGRICDISP